MSNETPQTDTSADDRVTAFAHAVLAGEIVAGPDVRNACRRHLRDQEHGPARGLVWIGRLPTVPSVFSKRYFASTVAIMKGCHSSSRPGKRLS